MFAKINSVIDHFEGKEWKFEFFVTYISLKTEEKQQRCPTSGAEKGHLQSPGRPSRA